MLGPDYSTKFSPWLAHGCLSPRTVHAELARYEKEHTANKSTYWSVRRSAAAAAASPGHPVSCPVPFRPLWVWWTGREAHATAVAALLCPPTHPPTRVHPHPHPHTPRNRVVFELLWRDWFRFLFARFGERLFWRGGFEGSRWRWRGAGDDRAMEDFQRWKARARACTLRGGAAGGPR